MNWCSLHDTKYFQNAAATLEMVQPSEEKGVSLVTEQQIANFRNNPEVGLAFQSALGKIANLSSQKAISSV